MSKGNRGYEKKQEEAKAIELVQSTRSDEEDYQLQVQQFTYDETPNFQTPVTDSCQYPKPNDDIGYVQKTRDPTKSNTEVLLEKEVQMLRENLK